MQTKNFLATNHRQISILESSLLGIIIALPLWPSYLAIKLPGLPDINLTRIFIFQALLLWIAALMINHASRIRLSIFLKENKRLLLLVMLPFFSWKIITAGFAPNRMPAAFSAMRDFIYFFGPFIISVSVWHTFIQLERVVKVLLMVSIIIFCVTVVEVINQQNLFINFVPDSFVSAQRLREGLVRDATYRAWGTFAHPIALAGYCTTVLPLAGWYTFAHRDNSRWFGLLVCASLLVSLILSSSRAGLVVLAFMAGGFLTVNYFPMWITKLKGKNATPKVILSFIMTLLVLYGVWFTGHNLATGRSVKEAGSTAMRLLQMELGLPLIKARPITGYGPGEAAEILGLSAKTVDNYYLTLSLESGLPELFFFIIVYFYFLKLAWKLQKVLPQPRSWLVIAIFWSIAGNALFLSVVSLEQTLSFVFLMFGMLISLDYMADKKNIEAL